MERSFHFGGIPLLAVAEGSGPGPAVLFYHGLHSSKETHLKELTQLAQQGFLALGVDVVGHGQRALPDLRGWLAQGSLLSQVSKLLRPTVAEIPLLIDFLAAEGYGPFGVCGISLGAKVAYAAPQAEGRLRSVVAILGDPAWCHPYEHLTAYESVALMGWNAGQDQHVAPAGARGWLTHLKETFPHGRYEYLEYPESDHFMREGDWNDGFERSLEWFRQTLRP